jgi:hypothetical protein
MRIDKERCSRPAILVGNGINNYARHRYQTGTLDFTGLLRDIGGDGIPGIRALLTGGKTAGISYHEIYELLCLRTADMDRAGEGKQGDLEALKLAIAKKLQGWQETEAHTKLASFARQHNIPILTTNYDELFCRGLTLRKAQNPDTPVHYRYPWLSCYGDRDIRDAAEEFAVWHIHGMIRQPRSLVLGLGGYVRFAGRVKEYVPTGGKEDKGYWRNTWLDVFFHRDLIITGLMLGTEEFGLRYLLFRREKYYRSHEERRRAALYVYVDEGDMDAGKRTCLEGAGVTIERRDTYAEVYDEWSFN